MHPHAEVTIDNSIHREQTPPVQWMLGHTGSKRAEQHPSENAVLGPWLLFTANA